MQTRGGNPLASHDSIGFSNQQCDYYTIIDASLVLKEILLSPILTESVIKTQIYLLPRLFHKTNRSHLGSHK